MITAADASPSRRMIPPTPCTSISVSVGTYKSKPRCMAKKKKSPRNDEKGADDPVVGVTLVLIAAHIIVAWCHADVQVSHLIRWL
jgi:hypothetical protein